MKKVMTRDELAKNIYRVAYLTGEFLLRSGQTSKEYFDKYRFESRPELLQAIAEQMAPLLPKDTEILAGLELGGVPIATALSLHTGIPVAFVRKKAKEYGTCQVSEGLDLKGKRVTIIEDVVTTGGQVVLSAQDLKASGAILSQVLCVIQRGDDKALREAGLMLTPLFRMEELKAFGGK